MIIHDKSLAKRFDPEEKMSEKCQQLIPLAGVDVRPRPDLDNYKQRTFFFSISDIPGNIQPSFTFCCQTSVERDKWVDRVSYLSILAIDLVEMEKNSRILQQKLFSATTLLKMDVGEKLLENITSGRYKRGTRRYNEVREHLDDYFKIWEGVMRKKVEVHNELLGFKTLTSPIQYSDKEANRTQRDPYSIEHHNHSNHESNVLRESYLQKQNDSDVSGGRCYRKDSKIASSSSEKTIGTSFNVVAGINADESIGSNKSGKHKQVKLGNDLNDGSDADKRTQRVTKNTEESIRYGDNSEDERSVKTVTSSVSRERARLSDIMKKVLNESGGRLPAGDDKTKKSILLKKIIAEINNNPQSNFDFSKVSKTLDKLGHL